MKLFEAVAVIAMLAVVLSEKRLTKEETSGLSYPFMLTDELACHDSITLKPLTVTYKKVDHHGLGSRAVTAGDALEKVEKRYPAGQGFHYTLKKGKRTLQSAEVLEEDVYKVVKVREHFHLFQCGPNSFDKPFNVSESSYLIKHNTSLQGILYKGKKVKAFWVEEDYYLIHGVDKPLLYFRNNTLGRTFDSKGKETSEGKAVEARNLFKKRLIKRVRYPKSTPGFAVEVSAMTQSTAQKGEELLMAIYDSVIDATWIGNGLRWRGLMFKDGSYAVLPESHQLSFRNEQVTLYVAMRKPGELPIYTNSWF